MSELELLKNHWKNHDNFPKKQVKELQLIIKKKSLNILNWLIIINFIVIGILLLSSLLAEDTGIIIINSKVTSFLKVLDYVLFLLPLISTIVCIYIIRKIKTDNSVATLLKNIIDLKKTVRLLVISYFLVYLIILLIGLYASSFTIDNLLQTENITESKAYIVFAITCIIVGGIYYGILWGIYKLTYRRFLKRLDENYKSLKEIAEN